MIFKNISILDENFNIKENRNVEIIGDKISKISINEIHAGDNDLVYNGKNRLLMPGFVNAHAHSPMSLLRGYGENMNLQDWLFKRIFPFEEKLTGDAVYYGTLLSMAESIKFGITSTSDMYYFTSDMVRAVEEAGTKANISRSITNPTGQAFESLNSIEEALDAAEQFHMKANGRIRIDHSLHAEYTSNEETVRKLAYLCNQSGLNMHVHVSETKLEHEECKVRHEGRTPIKYLADCGLFDSPTIAAHCVWIEGEDFDIIKDKSVTVATNPVSNMKLASGICDVNKLLQMGINVAIGTDSSASNNNLNILEEVKTMSLLAKVKSGDPKVITPKDALRIATLNGYIAQGRQDSGLIKEGQKADLIVIKTDSPNMCPKHNLINNLVLSSTPSDVMLTMVDGKILYENGEYTTIDIEKTIFEVDRQVKKIIANM